MEGKRYLAISTSACYETNFDISLKNSIISSRYKEKIMNYFKLNLTTKKFNWILSLYVSLCKIKQKV